MRGGLATTLSVLGKTKNDAATSVLLTALDASDRDLQAGALRSLLDRKTRYGHRQLLLRWHRLSERLKKVAAEKPGRMTGSLRSAILSADQQLAKNGCDATGQLHEYDLIPTLITAVEDKSSQCATLAAETLLSLTESLAEEIASPRDYQKRRSPQLLRTRLVSSLEQSMSRFDQHKRHEIVEAFLLLATTKNTLLNRILRNPRHPAHVATVHVLSHSPRPAVIQLLLNYLAKPDAPTSLDGIIARRRDLAFVRKFLGCFAARIPQIASNHLKRIESFSWLRDDMNLLSALNDVEQCGAIQVTMASGMKRLQVFEVVKFILTEGKVGGRRAAADALREFHGKDANELIVRALEDEDPTVQAKVAPLLRAHGIPGAMRALLDLLKSPHEEVRQAVRESLAEFTFERFAGNFDALDDDSRNETGELVRRVDPEAVEKLRMELACGVRIRRIRAVQMAVTMNAVVDVEDEVLAILSESDHVLRNEAARALALTDSDQAKKALRDMLLDRTHVVREAAEQSLQTVLENGGREQSGSQPPPVDWPSSNRSFGVEESKQ